MSQIPKKNIKKLCWPVIQNYNVLIKRVTKIFIIDLEINVAVNNNINVSMSPATAFIYNFSFEIVYRLVTPLILP